MIRWTRHPDDGRILIIDGETNKLTGLVFPRDADFWVVFAAYKQKLLTLSEARQLGAFVSTTTSPSDLVALAALAA